MTITVLDANRPPVLTAVGDWTVYEGQLIEISLSGTDPDGYRPDVLRNRHAGRCGPEPLDGRFTWTPGYDGARDYPVHSASGRHRQRYGEHRHPCDRP